MITAGGETAFVAKLIVESSRPGIRRKIQWFSAMLGKLSSVGIIVEKLREEKCANYAVTEFIQGQKTRRWCVAWSWLSFRPANDIARGVGSGTGVERKRLPLLTEMEFEIETVETETLGGKLGQEIKQLDGVLWKFDKAKDTGMFMSRQGDAWSRKARRKAKAQQEYPDTHPHAPRDARANEIGKAGSKNEDTEMKDQGSEDDDSEDEVEPALVARISIKKPPTSGNATGTRVVHIRHLQGHDSVLFESFCGWLKRKVVPP